MHFALISFLNARPLWWKLVEDAALGGDTFEFTSPARCTDLVAEGVAGLGLVPVIELARSADLVAFPSICIGSKTEVRSVLLVSRVPLQEIRSVALDPASRTSVALAKVILGERLGAPRLERIKFDAVESPHLLDFAGHDAAVVIGDPALQFSRRGRPGERPDEDTRGFHCYDLVSEWNLMFCEPFVFALWVGRRDLLSRIDSAELLARLEQSRDEGLARIPEIAEYAAEELQLPLEELLEYFQYALHYQLGRGEKSAISRFFALAAKYGVIEEPKGIEWAGELKS